jgi:hypothetical protein
LDSFRIVFGLKNDLGVFVGHFFDVKSIWEGKVGPKNRFFLEKGDDNICQLSDSACINYPTKYVGYRLPLSDFEKGRIPDHFIPAYNSIYDCSKCP